MLNIKRSLYPILAVLALATAIIPGCKSTPQEVNNALPYIPPSYYNCIQATAAEVAFSYWSPYSMRLKNEGSPIPGESYRDLVFVIKNYPITEWSLAELDKGYIRVDMIKCYPLNPQDFARLKAVTWVDVVGINKGPEQENYTDFSEGSLIFKDCIVLPAGAVKIPAEGNEGIPVYPSY
jgi:hypothetical protein